MTSFEAVEARLALIEERLRALEEVAPRLQEMVAIADLLRGVGTDKPNDSRPAAKWTGDAGGTIYFPDYLP